MKHLKEMHRWMNDYMKSFYTDDSEVMKGIKIKEEHTGYVTANMRALAEYFNLPSHEASLAEMIGLFHDVGRFRQYAIYKTFNDAQSEDHAVLGLKVLEELPFLSYLSEKDAALVRFAIGNHNKRVIAKTEDARAHFFARMIRDADKLDIYRVLMPYLSDRTMEEAPKFIAALSSRHPSPVFVEHLKAGRQADYHQIRTHGDRKIVRLLWIYDVNFAWTLKKIHERAYVDCVIKSLPHGREMSMGFMRLKNYMRERSEAGDIRYDGGEDDGAALQAFFVASLK